jgi:mono/diheme cytochrome c family protein
MRAAARTGCDGWRVVLPAPPGSRGAIKLTLAFGFLWLALGTSAADSSAVSDFSKSVQPILSKYCYDCHADGANKGGIAFDELKTGDKILDHDLWLKVLKNTRAGLMPPQKKPRPTADEQKAIETWVKYEAFGIDPRNPDPGRVTVRRLNRVEYKNTIRDLMGVDYDTEGEFPPDDTGYGFDTIADVLTLSPMLLEKYLDAARTIVAKAVPSTGAMPAEKVIQGRAFHGGGTPTGDGERGTLLLPYYEKASASKTFKAEHAGRYQINLDVTATERFVEDQFDYNKCRMIFKIDGAEVARGEYTREGGRAFHYPAERTWEPGDHQFTVEIEPLTPGEKQVRSLAVRIDQLTVRGPMEEKYWVRPKNYERFFGKEAPKGASERRQWARQILKDFATRAYRRPVDNAAADRLAKLAEEIYRHPGNTPEAGVAQAMVAVLASPRFLFREEPVPSAAPGQKYALLDEYSLASRLSYFLWSSLPDDELFKLAEKGELRKNLPAQVKRLLADDRSKAFVRNFTGQWLQARDVESVPIDSRVVLARDERKSGEFEQKRARLRELRAKSDQGLSAAEKDELSKLRNELFRSRGVELTEELRRGMRRETEMYFANLVREDRSLLELVDSDYTFLNEKLAEHYGLKNLEVKGDEMRLVKLPADSARGGVLTMGTVLVVTSNPTRTSPVKRGLFVLDNILGMPPPPPPPNIPPLEDAAKKIGDRDPTLRETLAMHRSKPLCSSCHNRMDPLGLAMENFNAMGMWRESEAGQPIDRTGQLLTGENFSTIKELKEILVKHHQRQIYRCLAEKLLTYAVGRGPEYYDVETIDQIVDHLEKENGRFSVLLDGVIESAPFQKTRTSAMVSQDDPKTRQPAETRVHGNERAAR